MARKYFGTDGIRGRANGEITPELALKVGQAAGLIFRRGDHRHRVLIGKDTRLSGYMIETALVAGFTSVGMDVLLTGPIPTPAVGMLTRSMRADLGVMISASHNPFDDNGIKLFGPDGFKLSDEVEHQIEALIDSELLKRLAKGTDLGRAKRIDGVQDRYIEFAKRTLPRNLSLGGLRVVVDCAHGAGYRVTPEALRELDAEVITMGVEPDGFNINHECGSTEPTALCQKVKEMRADIGIALDGDADRVLIVDERGRIVDGDQLLAVIAESWQADGRLAKPGVVATVMSNLGLERYLSFCPTTPRPAMVYWPHCRCSPWSRSRTSRSPRSATASIRCRRFSRTCATRAASRWRTPRCAAPSKTRKPASMGTAA
jgi:phosphoglucosamine mutase